MPDSPTREYQRLRPGPGLSRGTVEADQRARIRRAIIELVAAEGYRSVTVRKLAKLAGVSTETFYARFDGTADALASAYRDLLKDWRSDVVDSRDPTLDTDRQLQRSVDRLLAAIEADPKRARFALVGVLDGGPAALADLLVEERSLEAALRGCLDRRGMQIRPIVSEWIMAGTLYAARATVEGRWSASDVRRSLATWTRRLLREPTAGVMSVSSRRDEPPAPPSTIDLDPDGDRALSISALIKVALRESYWQLSISNVSKAAGISGSKLRHLFRNVEEGHLQAIEALALRYFDTLPMDARPRQGWRTATRDGVLGLYQSASIDPKLAELCFCGVLDPGVRGLTLRQRLVRHLAERWRAAAPVPHRPDQFVAELTIDGLWNSIAKAVRGREPYELALEPGSLATFVLGTGAS